MLKIKVALVKRIPVPGRKEALLPDMRTSQATQRHFLEKAFAQKPPPKSQDLSIDAACPDWIKHSDSDELWEVFPERRQCCLMNLALNYLSSSKNKN